MHLQPDELIDLAEGARAESSAPHLAACAVCRRQLDELKQAMAIAVDVDVPDPSPLFWDHLSRRVSEAVAADASRPVWWPTLDGPRLRMLVPALAGMLAAVLVAVVIQLRAPREVGTSTSEEAVAMARDVMPEPQAGDDPSLVLVAELTSEMDLDGAAEAGLAPRGSAEHAVTHMDGAELRELQRLLRQEMAISGG
jgi:hypothetical protein